MIEKADRRLMHDYSRAIETIHDLTEKLNKVTDEYHDFRIKYDDMQDNLFEACRLLVLIRDIKESSKNAKEWFDQKEEFLKRCNKGR
jgi:hypothetical protein